MLLLQQGHVDRSAVERAAAEALAEAHRAKLLTHVEPRIAEAVRHTLTERDAMAAPAVLGRPPGLPDWESAFAAKQTALRELTRWIPIVREAAIVRRSRGKPAVARRTPTRRVAPILQPPDIAILQALADAATTLHQHMIARSAQLSERTVSKRLKSLRAKGLCFRPNGDRGGDAITQEGKRVMLGAEPRPSG